MVAISWSNAYWILHCRQLTAWECERLQWPTLGPQDAHLQNCQLEAQVGVVLVAFKTWQWDSMLHWSLWLRNYKLSFQGLLLLFIKSFSIVMNIVNNAASYSTTSFYCIQWPWILHFLPPTSHVKNLKWRVFQKLKIGMKHLFLISSLWMAQEIYKLLQLCYVCMWHVLVIC
jgi:hypothetical protein